MKIKTLDSIEGFYFQHHQCLTTENFQKVGVGLVLEIYCSEASINYLEIANSFLQ